MYISGGQKGRGAEAGFSMYGEFQLGVQNKICATVAEHGLPRRRVRNAERYPG
jgi:hypothetical protein